MARPAFVYHPDYEMDIGAHVFPTSKFRMMKEQLVATGAVSETEIELAPLATDEELLSVLESAYVEDMRGNRHTHRTIRSELPLTAGIVRGCIRTAGGTILAAKLALARGAACHLGGGFHHGFADHGEGFCYINDVAIAAAVVRSRGLCTRVAVIDTDVHQGNGTAHIFQREAEVFTFSIHQEELYPVKQKSDLDIGLPVGIGDDGYNGQLAPAVDEILDRHKPELAIYVAGADPYEHDKLGSLGLSMQGMRRRDEIVLQGCARRGIPFVTVTAGGYARRLADTVDLHVQTIQVAIKAASRSTWEPRSGNGGHA